MTAHQRITCPGWPEGSCSTIIWRSSRLCQFCKRTKGPGRATGTVEERFWRHVDKSGECWEWTGGRNKQGYGKACGEHRQFWGAHRLSWALHNGEIPDGLAVLHRCDNPPCVRPDHLWLGTLRDNQQDMYDKGRARDARGRPKTRRVSRKAMNRPRLTPQEVGAIRNRPRKHGSLKRVADELGIGYMRAWMVSVGRSYREGVA